LRNREGALQKHPYGLDTALHLDEALGRLRAVFRGTAGVELAETDVAKLAGLDDEECRKLLGVLEATGAVERRRSRRFACGPASWWTSVPADS
jgi:DNA-binding IclR family transcriptional regulator